MGKSKGNSQGGRFAAGNDRSGASRSTKAWVQILVSLALLLDLFLLYTIIMQLTHQQKAFEASDAVNYALLAVFGLGAGVLTWLLIRTRAWKRALCLLLVFLVLYLIAAYSELPLVKKYRDIWISTAMSTMRHQGLATYYFPESVVDERMRIEAEARNAQVGNNTQDTFVRDADDQSWWVDPTDASSPADLDIPEKEFQILTPEQKRFYALFYELDRESAEAWFQAHPESVANGYDHILINETSLDGNGTTIRTTLGEKVLAIDVENQLLIVEVDCDGSRGVLAIGKLPSRLHLFAAANLPYYGETAGSIAKRNNGLLAMTGSGFDDPDGVGNGGQVAGYARCDGKDCKGEPFKWGYKRIELRENNWFYITDTYSSVNSETTDAMEFTPALVINGEKLDPSGWTGQNPRACIGQSERGEILMLCVEGRRLDSPGCSVAICADVLLAHDCITALNCDGGTTAIMWYRGEPIIRCSNSSIPQGRHLPNAWVYVAE